MQHPWADARRLAIKPNGKPIPDSGENVRRLPPLQENKNVGKFPVEFIRQWLATIPSKIDGFRHGRLTGGGISKEAMAVNSFSAMLFSCRKVNPCAPMQDIIKTRGADISLAGQGIRRKTDVVHIPVQGAGVDRYAVCGSSVMLLFRSERIGQEASLHYQQKST
ncbi:hypothetical protein BBOH_0558 [Bifidobacterium bohemicum DSM 22767]|uniref:Uncharacterized protein n=1 Tax=Bifidobacterium bohemicum DSM 22767 TaxID=1437606 RepID=A0A086ZGV6_9BIFI|nr:hypothetical protein BBOH_0558 [Bifidobacterium bohemicum DSM 22767]